MSDDGKVGKEFEGKIEDTLKELMKTCPIRPVRLYDTRSARGAYLPPQPGDWIIAHPGGCTLLEAKASRVHGSLRSCLAEMVGLQQVAEHRLWHRTGNDSWFIFYGATADRLELWDGRLVAEHRVRGRPLPANALSTEVGSIAQLVAVLKCGLGLLGL